MVFQNQIKMKRKNRMLTQEKIEEITDKTTRLVLKELFNTKASTQELSSLASSICATVIFNLCNSSIKGDKEIQRFFYAMAMWSINKNIYKILEAKGIEEGNFSMTRKKWDE